MSLEIHPISSIDALLEPISRLYNEAIQALPYAYEILPSEIALAAPIPCDDLEKESLIIWRQDHIIRAYAHVARQVRNHWCPRSPVGTGQIRFLLHDPQAQKEAKAVLDAAEAFLFQWRPPEIRVFQYSYHFHRFGALAISAKLEHVTDLLTREDYRISDQWRLFWRKSIDEALPIDKEMSFSFEEDGHQGPFPEFTARVAIGGTEAGRCRCHAGNRYMSSPLARDILFISQIGIDEEYRGRGLGKALMKYTMGLGHSFGFRKVALYTDVENMVSKGLYESLGFCEIEKLNRYTKTLVF